MFSFICVALFPVSQQENPNEVTQKQAKNTKEQKYQNKAL